MTIAVSMILVWLTTETFQRMMLNETLFEILNSELSLN